MNASETLAAASKRGREITERLVRNDYANTTPVQEVNDKLAAEREKRKIA